jgi:glycosyltransferase involved in cell wall biosynthesis
MRNDLSGSTKILTSAIEALLSENWHVDLYCSTFGFKGFLSDLEPRVSIKNHPYRRFKNKWLSAASFFYAQLWIFFQLLLKPGKYDGLYVNTLLPFGAAWAGKILHLPVLYHIHEISLAPIPRVLRPILTRTAEACAWQTIYVSDYLMKNSPVVTNSNIVIRNALDQDFVDQAKRHLSKRGASYRASKVLMICSLAEYKGLNIYMELARQTPEIQFDLVLNATEEEVKYNLHQHLDITNLNVHSAVVNVHPFYQNARVLLNLSLMDRSIETFGMTLLEAISYGIPCIAPPVGGVVEIIENNINGYLIDSRNFDELKSSLIMLMNDDEEYSRLSQSAIAKSCEFSIHKFNLDLTRQFNHLLS